MTCAETAYQTVIAETKRQIIVYNPSNISKT